MKCSQQQLWEAIYVVIPAAATFRKNFGARVNIISYLNNAAIEFFVEEYSFDKTEVSKETWELAKSRVKEASIELRCTWELTFDDNE